MADDPVYSTTFHVVVIGGGAVALAAADEIAKTGNSVLLLDRRPDLIDHIPQSQTIVARGKVQVQQLVPIKDSNTHTWRIDAHLKGEGPCEFKGRKIVIACGAHLNELLASSFKFELNTKIVNLDSTNLSKIEATEYMNSMVLDHVPERFLQGGAAKSVAVATADGPSEAVAILGCALKELVLDGASKTATQRPNYSFEREASEDGQALLLPVSDSDIDG